MTDRAIRPVREVIVDGERFALVPWAEFEAMTAAQAAFDEDAADRAALDAVRADPAEEWLPDALVDRLLAGDHPVRVWREHRGTGVAALAAAAGIDPSYLYRIELGARKGDRVLPALARALGVRLDPPPALLSRRKGGTAGSPRPSPKEPRRGGGPRLAPVFGAAHHPDRPASDRTAVARSAASTASASSHAPSDAWR